MTIIELEAHRHTITTPQGPVSCIDVGSSTSPSICLTWAQTSITSLDGRSQHPLRRPPGDVTDICCHGSNRGAPSRHTRYSRDGQGSNDHEGERTMARARHSVDIARPIEDVFDFLANGANNPRWQKRVTSTTQLGDTLGVGTAFKQSMRHPLGFSVPASYRITAFERPRRLATTGTSDGPIRPTETYELAENATGGTTVSCTIDVRPAGAARIAAPLLAFLHPLFAWEASWLDNARDILQGSSIPG